MRALRRLTGVFRFAVLLSLAASWAAAAGFGPRTVRAASPVSAGVPARLALPAPARQLALPAPRVSAATPGSEQAWTGELRNAAHSARSLAQAGRRAVREAGRTRFPELGTPQAGRLLVEGSKEFNGTQNHFLIDPEDAELSSRLIQPARRIGASGAEPWAKVREIQKLVNSVVPRDGIKNSKYIRFNASALSRDHVSLGEYLKVSAGVCRENALLTALALREAGFDARFAYFTVLTDAGAFSTEHGVALLDLEGTTYVIDSYRPLGRYFNGHRLADLLSPPADGLYPLAAPLAAENASGPGRWRFEPLSFPRVRILN